MRTYRVWCLGLCLLVSAAALRAEPTTSAGKIIKETWDVAYLEGGKVGYYHTTVREIQRDGLTLLRTAVELDLTIKRYKAIAHLRMETGNDETPDGKVLGVVLRQFLDKDQQVLVTGIVEGKQLHVRTSDGRVDNKIPWNDDVIGLYQQDRLFQQRKVKPGDRFTYLSYEPSITSVITMRVTVKDEEEVEVLGVKKKLLRVESVADKIQGPKGPIPLPTLTSWLDKDFQPARSQMEMPELGTITMYRGTREAAMAPATQLTDIGPRSFIRLNRTIERPYDTKAAVYRITVKGDDDPATTFAEDNRQTVKNVQGGTFDLHVQAVRSPQPVDHPSEAKEEFTKSCFYLNSDDARVKELAAKAVAQEKDPWRKAQWVERWVHDHVTLDNSVPFAGADKVAENLKGDCRHKAMLAAAMCRAVGVPSRTAVGLVYTNDRQSGPVMAFHMWAEVWVSGQWVAIDGTLGQGSVGADHIKIADASWYETQSLTPLLPVARVLGKVSIEVVTVNGKE